MQKRARRRGEHKIIKATTAVPGMFGLSRPLEVVQIDHTNADIFVVDEETRVPIGRLAVSSQDDCVIKITKLGIASSLLRYGRP
jgi:hypothetical protein